MNWDLQKSRSEIFNKKSNGKSSDVYLCTSGLGAAFALCVVMINV